MKVVEFPYVVVRLGCNLCGRKNAYRLARIAVAFGPEAAMGDVLEKLAASCPWRMKPYERSRNQYRPRCHAQFTDLTERTPPDMPPGVGGLRVIEGGLSDDDPAPGTARRKPRRKAE